jgi:hypothetical protein
LAPSPQTDPVTRRVDRPMEPADDPSRRAGMRSARPVWNLALAACLAALVLVVTACSSGATPSASPPAAAGSDPLVTVETRGGLCAAGACAETVMLERDGRVHVAAKPPNDLGTVPPGPLAALESAIAATDFAALRAHPFTGQCPTAVDGQELVFEFSTSHGIERIATCKVDVDFGSPLFEAVSAALGSYVALPAG